MSIPTTQLELPRKRFLITLALVIIFFVIGQYHIVLDAPWIFVARPYFWFSDIIAESGVCTTWGRIFTKSKHPSLCTALQQAWVIESDESFQERTTKKIQEDIEEQYWSMYNN